jgi:RHS repeat-associated protein
LNQVMDQKTPDAGASTFRYDRLGRLIVSQNARQNTDKSYSYTLFDELGRIREVGEIASSIGLTFTRNEERTIMVQVCGNKTYNRTREVQKPIYGTITIPGVGTFSTSEIVGYKTVIENYTEVVYECNDEPQKYQELVTIVVNKSEVEWQKWINQGVRRQMTQTKYDASMDGISDLFGSKKQENLRNRVASTMYKEKQTDATFQHATHYSYDIMGNVKTLIQDYPEFAKKRMDYQFDQLSGKVNLVAYQHGQKDAFYHRYKYDADLRLRSAETSRDQVIWDCEAVYKYYRHGPMRRMEIGHEHIQGMDYYYTLQGWIKGVNHGAGAEDALGNDGKTGTVYGNFGKDAFAYNLSYHTDDYKPISAKFVDVSKQFIYDVTQTDVSKKATLEGYAPSLYNGNIRAMWGGLDKFVVPAGNNGKGGGNTPVIPTAQGQVFKYDQLNRLIQSRDYTMTGQELSNATEHHGMNLTYDGNGNIQTLKRKGVDKKGAVTSMDDLGYEYKVGTNQLTRVRDGVDKKNFDNDIDDQGAVLENYTYDAIGNLKTDVSEGITNITWNVYGKMTTVIKTKEKESQFYYYDAGGNRVKKKDGNDKETFYVRDAQGNVMATYERAKKNDDLMVSSFYIYGSSRIGSLDAQVNMQTATVPTTQFSRIRGQRRYEMSNHLGNVMVVVSDRKVVQTDGSTLADLVSTTDYYAFGMVMSDRSWNTEGYRFGFNGKENDNEIKGTGNQQDYGMRIYDPRLGRFLSVDPLTKDYPTLTPFQFASNNPIEGVDMDGLEYLSSKVSRLEFTWGKLLMKIENFHNVNINKFEAANNNPNNWNKNEIGISREIATITFKGLKTVENNSLPLPDNQANAMKDILEDELHKGVKAQDKGISKSGNFLPMQGVPDAKGMKPSVGRGMSAASAVLDLVDFGAAQLVKYHFNDDITKIKEDFKLATLALQNLNSAINDGLVPQKFLNEKDLSDLGNVILQGKSNYGNKEIEALGINIYERYKPGKKDPDDYNIKVKPKWSTTDNPSNGSKPVTSN